LKCLVTGAAGFIGSHLSEALVGKGHQVLGVDNFSDYYPRRTKEANLSSLRNKKGFEFRKVDIASDNLSRIFRDVEYVFHLAAQPGVRGSWGGSFAIYIRDNVLATQRLLEAVKRTPVKKLIYASSSSIYGDAELLPTPEDTIPKPISPYGVTKLAGEHLCLAYHRSHDVPCVILRYFSVYGPRQRPDMAFSIFISRITSDQEITINGDGNQERDFTLVGDTVNATMSAMDARPGVVYNVGSGRAVSLNEAIGTLEGLLGKRARIRHSTAGAGDVKSTCADISRIAKDLRFEPKTALEEGLTAQIRAHLTKG